MSVAFLSGLIVVALSPSCGGVKKKCEEKDNETGAIRDCTSDASGGGAETRIGRGATPEATADPAQAGETGTGRTKGDLSESLRTLGSGSGKTGSAWLCPTRAAHDASPAKAGGCHIVLGDGDWSDCFLQVTKYLSHQWQGECLTLCKAVQSAWKKRGVTIESCMFKGTNYL